MKIFEDISDARRVICYDKFNLSLMERHHAWCLNKAADEKNIFIIFFLRDQDDIKLYRSNRLDNKFCIVYDLPAHRTDEWIQNFCKICISEEDMKTKRILYLQKDTIPTNSSLE